MAHLYGRWKTTSRMATALFLAAQNVTEPEKLRKFVLQFGTTCLKIKQLYIHRERLTCSTTIISA
jgi:hypothetical protein